MSGDGEGPPFSGPVKHSVTIAGHRTSISLEPIFWAALRRAAEEEGVSVHALVARIDAERIAQWGGGQQAEQAPPNLTSALRSWLWMRYCK